MATMRGRFFAALRMTLCEQAAGDKQATLHGETRNRELTALREAMREQKLDCGTVVTRDESDELTVDEGRICIVPVWRYLLQME